MSSHEVAVSGEGDFADVHLTVINQDVLHPMKGGGGGGGIVWWTIFIVSTDL